MFIVHNEVVIIVSVVGANYNAGNKKKSKFTWIFTLYFMERPP